MNRSLALLNATDDALPTAEVLRLALQEAVAEVGGLGGLVRVIHKLRRSVLRRSTLDATSYYWHFMGVLWLYLFLLLWVKV